MIQLNYRYDRDSARLKIEGLPDKSRGQSDNTIGIISSWKLDLVGAPTLEGKREHLEALVNVVSSYSRFLISGVYRSFGDSNSPVQISKNNDSHRILLKSSNEEIDPLEILLDDAELVDLTLCLDELVNDYRVEIDWRLPKYKPLGYKDNIEKVPLKQRLTAGMAGITSFILLALIYMSIPLPESVHSTNPKVDAITEIE